MNKRGIVLKEIARSDVLRFGMFEDSEGNVTPYYLDLTRLWKTPELLRAIGELILEDFEERKEVNAVCGAGYTGTPLATIVSQLLKRPLVIASENEIFGSFEPGAKVMIVDDVIATGNKANKIVKRVMLEGGQPYVYVVILDKGIGGSNKLTQMNVKFFSLFSLEELIAKAYELGVIGEEELRALREKQGRLF
ncbi:MAG: orotate phosphoribosyltransferase [Thermoproteota archaeon]